MNRRTSVEGELPDWEALRAAGSIIKAHDMRYLDYFLLQLEASVPRAGGSRIHEERAPIRIGIGRVLVWEPHYSRTCWKKQKAEGMERLSSLECVHPSLKGGGRLFQRSQS
jgi:hypothetical protein